MRRGHLLLLAAVLIFLTLQPAFCAQSEIDKCVARLEKSYEKMQDFYAVFEQETHLSAIKRVEKGKGEVYFKKPGRMLWQYQTPEVQKIILDGKNLWLYRPEEKQVMKNDFSAIPANIVLDLFRGKIKIQQEFKVVFIQREVKDKESRIVLQLVPLIYNPTITRVTLWIDPDRYLIARSQLEDEFGTRTTLIFSSIKIDKGIDNAVFEFKPPAGVEVFEPPRL